MAFIHKATVYFIDIDEEFGNVNGILTELTLTQMKNLEM